MNWTRSFNTAPLATPCPRRWLCGAFRGSRHGLSSRDGNRKAVLSLWVRSVVMPVDQADHAHPACGEIVRQGALGNAVSKRLAQRPVPRQLNGFSSVERERNGPVLLLWVVPVCMAGHGRCESVRSTGRGRVPGGHGGDDSPGREDVVATFGHTGRIDRVGTADIPIRCPHQVLPGALPMQLGWGAGKPA